MTQAKQYRRLGKFELHQLIGEGAMGVVWKPYDSVLRRYVALKLLPARVSRTGDIRERFLREARAAGVVQHSNIVTIYDLGEAENQLFIAMELVDGRDLSAIITEHEPLPPTGSPWAACCTSCWATTSRSRPRRFTASCTRC